VDAAANDLLPSIRVSSARRFRVSLKYFEVRRYGITATDHRNTRIQVGAFKVFNKY
jgi:hypothetical protein